MPTLNNSTSGRTASLPILLLEPTKRRWSATSLGRANRNVYPPSLSLMRTKSPNRPPRSTVSSSPRSPIRNARVSAPRAACVSRLVLADVPASIFHQIFLRLFRSDCIRTSALGAAPSGICKCVTSFFCRNICKSRLFFVPLHQNTRIALRDTYNIN